MEHDTELFGHLKHLADKYRKNYVGILHSILIVLLAIWIKQVDAEQQRRSVPVEIVEKTMLQNFNHTTNITHDAAKNHRLKY